MRGNEKRNLCRSAQSWLLSLFHGKETICQTLLPKLLVPSIQHSSGSAPAPPGRSAAQQNPTLGLMLPALLGATAEGRSSSAPQGPGSSHRAKKQSQEALSALQIQPARGFLCTSLQSGLYVEADKEHGMFPRTDATPPFQTNKT